MTHTANLSDQQLRAAVECMASASPSFRSALLRQLLARNPNALFSLHALRRRRPDIEAAICAANRAA